MVTYNESQSLPYISQWLYDIWIFQIRNLTAVRPVAQRVAVRVVKSWVSSPASEWVTQQVTLRRVVGGRWHMTGQARVALHRRPLPIHLCLPPLLPTLHTLILHTNTCYVLARKLPVSNPRNCRRATRLQGNIIKKILQRVPARVLGNFNRIFIKISFFFSSFSN